MKTEAQKVLDCGVYALFDKGKCVYVGKSAGLKKRLVQHSRSFVYDDVQTLLCPKQLLEYVELLWISEFKPTRNKASGSIDVPDCRPSDVLRMLAAYEQDIVCYHLLLG